MIALGNAPGKRQEKGKILDTHSQRLPQTVSFFPVWAIDAVVMGS
jgi:hypothetical protein